MAIGSDVVIASRKLWATPCCLPALMLWAELDPICRIMPESSLIIPIIGREDLAPQRGEHDLGLRLVDAVAGEV